MPAAIFEVYGLTKVYHTGEVEIRALSNIELTLYDGEQVVLHPSDRIADGTQIEQRQSEAIARCAVG